MSGRLDTWSLAKLLHMQRLLGERQPPTNMTSRRHIRHCNELHKPEPWGASHYFQRRSSHVSVSATVFHPIWKRRLQSFVLHRSFMKVTPQQREPVIPRGDGTHRCQQEGDWTIVARSCTLPQCKDSSESTVVVLNSNVSFSVSVKSSSFVKSFKS